MGPYDRSIGRKFKRLWQSDNPSISERNCNWNLRRRKTKLTGIEQWTKQQRIHSSINKESADNMDGNLYCGHWCYYFKWYTCTLWIL